MTLKEYNNRVKKYLPGGVHYNFHTPWQESPLHFIKARDSRLWDMDDVEYLDLYSRFGANIVGHGNQEYSEALKDIIDRVLCVSHCDLDAEVLEILAKHIPSAEMIRFGVSGTEIIQNAIRLARAWTGKNRFVRFEGHYHGNADNIMGGRVIDPQCPIPHDFNADVRWTAGRAHESLESQSYLIPWNNADILEELLIKHGANIAAVITEPVCISAGSIMPAPGYLEKMRQLCDQYGVVLIFDEIVTGVRMGLGGAQREFQITPDLTTLGKAIAGGGVPIAALAGKREIMQLLVDKKVVHAGTFNGYPLGAAAIKITYELLSKDGGAALLNMNKTMQEIHDIFVRRASYYDLPLVIQGPVACASFHCVETPLVNTSDYTDDILFADVILNANLATRGVLVSPSSRLFPNIALSEEDVELFRLKIDKALLETKMLYNEM